jgi:branched-chain amino acid transport system ATP-binding protein
MLRVNNLVVHYSSVQVLRGVSLDVHDGEIVTLIGANGAGKTTFLLTLSGMLRVTSGTIEFLGIKLDKLPPHKIVSLGLVQVPQGRQLFHEMTALENLELGGQQSAGPKEMRQKLDAVYSYFEVLSTRENQKAGTLSGGEQQMLAIARALMASPRLLLMDEPSSGLAPTIVENLAQIISKLRNGGMTILLIEQNAYLALELADRGYVLANGSVVTSGRGSDLAQSESVKKAYLGA